MKLMDLFVKIGFDDSEFNRGAKGAEKNAHKLSEGVGRVLGNISKVAAGAVATAGASCAAIVTKALGSVAELEQNVGGSEAIFAGWSKDVQKKASEAYKTMGVSYNQYLATVNKMGALMQGSGIAQGKSYEMATEWMQRAADVAAVQGVDIVTAMDAITGAAKGNFTMLDNIGVAISDSDLDDKLKELFPEAKEYDKMMKITAAYEKFMEATNRDDYKGDFAKERLTTMSGAATSMKAAWDNLLNGTTSADDFYTELENTLSLGSDGLLKIVPRLVDSFSTVFAKLAESENLQKILSALPEPFAEAIVGLISGLTKSLPQLIKAFSDVAVGVIDGFAKALSGEDDTLAQSLMATVKAIGNALLDVGATIMKYIWNGITGDETTTEEVKETILSLLGLGEGWENSALYEFLKWMKDTLIAARDAARELFRIVNPQSESVVELTTGTYDDEQKRVLLDAYNAEQRTGSIFAADDVIAEYGEKTKRDVAQMQAAYDAVKAYAKEHKMEFEAALGIENGTQAKWQKTINNWVFKARVIPVIDGASGGTANNPNYQGGGGVNKREKMAVGQEYIPYDDYPAMLHKGEAVLTRTEAEKWRAGSSNVAIDYGRLAAAVASAVRGITVTMDGETVGRMVSPSVDEEIGKMVFQRRYSRA